MVAATAAIALAAAVSVTGARGAATVRPALVDDAAPGDGARRGTDRSRQPAAARPDQAGDLRIVGQLGGDVRAVARVGDWAVIGIGPRVAVVDIADPTTPRLLGQTGLLAGTVIDLEVQGTLAYAIAGGLSVVDLADPSAPREIGHAAVGAHDSLYGWTGPSRLAVGDGVVAMIGHSVYRFGRPLFVDVTDPTSPVPLAELELDGGADVAMDGRVAYIGTCEGTRCRGAGRGLLAFDLADPAAPRLIGEVTAPGMVWRLALAGPHVAVLSSECQAGLIDVSDPSAMSLRVCHGRWDNHSRTPDDGLVDLAFDGATLTVADEYGGWHALDPTAALTTAVGYAHVASVAYGVAWADGWALVAAGPDGLRIVDARHVADPDLLGELDLDDVAPLRDRAIAATERRLYVSASGPESRGITIVDVSDPASPRRMGTVPVAARHIAPLGDRYLVADDEAVRYAGLRIIDVTDPAHAVDVATLPLSATVAALTVAGSSVYVAERNGLTVVDVADPTQPITAVQVPLLFGANDVAVRGDVAYVAGHLLSVVDLRDLPRPVIRAELGDPDMPQTRHVAVDGDRMFMTGDARDVWAFDVTNPRQPTELWRVHTPYPSGYPVDLLAVRDGRVYMAGEGGGVWVFDVTGPALRLVSTVAPLLGGTWWVGQAQFATLAGGVTCVLDAYQRDAPGATPDPAPAYRLRLRLFDLADGSDIRTVGVFGAGGGFRDLVADRTIAYVADPSTGVHVVDTSDASAPVELAAVPVLDGALNLAGRGDHVYVLAQRLVGERPRQPAAYETALATLDVADPAHPSLVETTGRVGMKDIAVIGDNLAVADDRGLFVFDIVTDPGRPLQIGHVGSSVSDVGYAFVAGAGRYALVVRRAVTVGAGGPSPRRMPPILRVVDLASPESPRIVAEIPIGDTGTPASVRDIAVTGRYAYIAYGLDLQMNGALVVVDVADPTDPEVVGYWDSAEPGLPVVPVEPSGVDGDARTAFLGSYAGIRALDMTVPGYPLELARLDTPDEGLYRRLGLAACPDGMLLLARGDAGLVVAGADLPTRETPTAGPSPTRTASATPLPTFTRLPTNTPTPRVWPTRGPTRTPTPWPTDLAWTATAGARTATIEALTRTPVPTDLPWTATLAARTATAAARTSTAAARTGTASPATGTPPGTVVVATPVSTQAAWTATAAARTAAAPGTAGTATATGTAGTRTPATGTPWATGTPTGTTDRPARVWLPMLLDRG